jgi:hypothetical protein
MPKPAANPKSGSAKAQEHPQVFLVPCSCGRNIAVAGSDPPPGPHGRHLLCPNCGKKHDRHFRAMRFDYGGGYWTSEGC